MARVFFVYGYPGFVGNNILTRAVTRGGIVAWTDPNGPSSNPFLIDAAIFPGNSGGPVFANPSGVQANGVFSIGGKAAWLGIVSKSYGTQLQNGSQIINLQGFGSLGVVEPVSEVRKLLVNDMHVTLEPFATPSPRPPPR